jgi:hypothetical protein
VLIPGRWAGDRSPENPEIDDDVGQRLVRIIRGQRGRCDLRQAQIVLLPARGMHVPAIAKVAFTSEDRARDVIRSAPPDSPLTERLTRAGKIQTRCETHRSADRWEQAHVLRMASAPRTMSA